MSTEFIDGEGLLEFMHQTRSGSKFMPDETWRENLIWLAQHKHSIEYIMQPLGRYNCPGWITPSFTSGEQYQNANPTKISLVEGYLVDIHVQSSFFASKPQSDLSGGVYIWHLGINFVRKCRRHLVVKI